MQIEFHNETATQQRRSLRCGVGRTGRSDGRRKGTKTLRGMDWWLHRLGFALCPSRIDERASGQEQWSTSDFGGR